MSEKDRSCDFEEVQYFEGEFINNINNACSFQMHEQSHLLFASKTKLLCLGSEWGNYRLQEISPTGISEDSNIITIDALSTSKSIYIALAFQKLSNAPADGNRGFNVGRERGDYDPSSGNQLERSTGLKSTSSSNQEYFHITGFESSNAYIYIYSGLGDLTTESRLPRELSTLFASTPQRIDIGYLPSRITNWPTAQNAAGSATSYFLVAGSDSKIHLYEQSRTKRSALYGQAIPAQKYKSTRTPDEYQTGSRLVANMAVELKERPMKLGGDNVHSLFDEDLDMLNKDQQDSLLDARIENLNKFKDAHSKIKQTSMAVKDMQRFLYLPVEGVNELFQSLSVYNNPPLSISTLPVDVNGSRIVCGIGCEDGSVRFAKYDLQNTMEDYSTDVLEGPIPTVQVIERNDVSTFDLLVGGSLGYAAIYEDVVNNPIQSQEASILPNSTHHDSVLCSNLADLNWDGRDEVILGTYGQELLVYERMEEGSALRGAKHIHQTDDQCCYKLKWQRSFAYPLYSINTGDFNQDGVDELVVNSLHGIHILQPNLEEAADKIELTIEKYKALQSLSESIQGSLSLS